MAFYRSYMTIGQSLSSTVSQSNWGFQGSLYATKISDQKNQPAQPNSDFNLVLSYKLRI